MAHALHYSCPNCDLAIDPPQADGALFVCPECRSRYTVLIDEDVRTTGKRWKRQVRGEDSR